MRRGIISNRKTNFTIAKLFTLKLQLFTFSLVKRFIESLLGLLVLSIVFNLYIAGWRCWFYMDSRKSNAVVSRMQFDHDFILIERRVDKVRNTERRRERYAAWRQLMLCSIYKQQIIPITNKRRIFHWNEQCINSHVNSPRWFFFLAWWIKKCYTYISFICYASWNASERKKNNV